MHILLTGGAGYIGSHVALDLLDAGHEITVFDNLSTGNRGLVPEEARFVQGDICDAADLDRAFSEGIEAVFHFAALKAAGDSMIEPQRYARINISGSLQLFHAMLKHGVNLIVFSSSAAVYGFPEYLPIDEAHPVVPANYYGYTKLVIEANLEWFSRLKGLRYAALRYFNAAGYDTRGRIHIPEQKSANLLPLVMETAVRKRNRLKVYGTDYETADGTCLRDYIHVSDLSSAHLLALDSLIKDNENLKLNLGTGRSHSVFEVIEATRNITGKPIEIELAARRAGDPAELWASSAAAGKQLGWHAEHSGLNEIIESLWQLYQRL